ncbi:hypothetical protein [Dubosiella newyorkensis]
MEMRQVEVKVMGDLQAAMALKTDKRLLFWILSNWRWRRFVDGDRSEWK